MMTSVFLDMANVVPEAVVGLAKVEHFTVSESDSRWSSIRPGDFVPPGKYARLFVGGRLMMSDTTMERATNYEVVREARGDVLIAGLGLGLILLPILRKKEVRSVLVVEKYQDVVAAVAPAIRAAAGKDEDKLGFVVADIMEWKPAKGLKWDCIYFDIWPDVCTDNLEEMATLHRRFARRNKGWMGSWNQDTLRYYRDRDRRSGW
jgi:hypothetical protein